MSLVHLAVSRHALSHAIRDSIQRQAGELVRTELGRCDDEWRSALLSVREAVAALERTYESAVNRDRTMPSGAVSDLIESIIATATDEASRAAEHAQGEVRVQLGQAQALAARLEAELTVARDELTQARAMLDGEHAARARVEVESADARTRYEHTIAERESELRRHVADADARRQECAALSQQLEAAHVRNEGLLKALQAVHGHIQHAMTSVRSTGSDATGGGTDGNASTGATPHTAAPASGQPSHPPADGTATQATAVEAGVQPTQPPTTAPVAEPPEPQLATYVTSLLDVVETSYKKDLESGLVPLDVVQRLTANLRHARDLFVARADDQPVEASFFETALMRLVDMRGATAFGRHLGIAAYELFAPRPS